MAMDVLAEMDREMTRAATPRASRKPVFLFLAENQKALVRPTYNLDQAILLQKHNRWHENRDFRVNAICAAEVGQPCEYCQMASEDKKLTASPTFYVPVFVYSVTNTKTGEKVTIKDEAQQEKPLQGFRVLELTAFGRVASILKTLRSQYRDEDEHDITACDFSIEQSGAGQKKDFVVLPKAPKPMDTRIRAKAPSLEQFRKAIFEACPPHVLDGSIPADDSIADESSAAEEDNGDDVPDF